MLAGADGETVSAIIFTDPAVLSSKAGIAAPRMPLEALTPKNFSTPRLIRLAEQVSEPLLRVSGDSDRDREATSTITADGAERALLFGRYVSQINARIERAWVRPHASPGVPDPWGRARGRPGAAAAARFDCRVEIDQSGSGRVLEVTLVRCDSNPRWQESLVQAIDAASPLPAPPNPSVFARSLVLDFTSAVPSAGLAAGGGGAR
jgi:hypothetical protein